MDFIAELLESSGKTIIWIITDLFSNHVHFMAYPKSPLHVLLQNSSLSKFITSMSPPRALSQ